MQHHIRPIVLSFASASLALASCDDPADAPAAATEDRAAQDALVEYIDPEHADPAPRQEPTEHKLAVRPRRNMPDGQRAFEEVVELIRTNYVDGPMETDAMWTAATEGILSRLIQIEGAHINTLMSPRDLEELRIGTQGQLIGVGVMIEMVADVVFVRDVLPGGPAAAAGLQAGDRVLGINGQRVKGMLLDEIVGKIRGTEGSEVTLFVQRDTQEWDAELTRARITYSSVAGTMLTESVGYLRITQFSNSTAKNVDGELAELEAAGMKALVVDVRDCPGGLLDASLEVTDLFLPPGLPIMSISGPKSGEETLRSEREDRWETLPMVALVGPHTASGAEILTAALQHHDRARIIGARTMGKGTVEAVHELSNGWGLKLSASRFRSAGGEVMLERGVKPDIEMPTDDKPPRGPLGEFDPDPETDPQLAAALALTGD